VGGVITGSSTSVSANVTGGNINTGGIVSATGNIVSSTATANISAAGNVVAGANIFDSIGPVRNIPINTQSANYTLALSDNGKFVSTTAQLNIPNTVFSAGNAITLFNNSAANISIAAITGTTVYLAGTATTGNRTLTQRGLATLLCVAANTFVISGAGLF
jgi:hypothetical protein